jgi:hypothetical protein
MTLLFDDKSVTIINLSWDLALSFGYENGIVMVYDFS